MTAFHNDLRFGWRLYAKSPAITAVLLLSLALGIGATTTMFSVIYGLLLAPPLYKDTNRLVVVWESNPANGLERSPVAPATFRDWLEDTRSFQDLELVAPGSPVTVTSGELPERANIQYATPGLFDLLGIRPAAGRFFRADELKSTSPVILSHSFWTRHFPTGTDIIGRQITVNGTAQTVVGVLPRGFHLFESDTDLWMPIARPGPEAQDRSFRSWLIAVGRLAPGATLRSAQVEMNFLAQRIASSHPDSNKGWGVRVDPIQDAQFGYWKPILFLMFGIASLVLLISCANVASLLLARLSSRSRELSVRASLGAGRRAIIRQLLTEGLLLGTAGSVLGSFLAYFGIRLFAAFAPEGFPLLQGIRINPPVLFFCAAISIASGVAASLSPAYFASRLDLIRVLKSTAQTTIGGAWRRSRDAFVVLEIALSLTLLFGAGLMINSMMRLLRVNAGFHPENVLTMQMFLAGPKYFEFADNGVNIREGVKDFYGRLLERTAAIPGVSSAGLVSWLPEMGYNTGRRERTFRISGSADSNPPSAAFNMVSADYFKTLQIPLLRGRFFAPQDDESATPVALVNQSFARRFFAGKDPLGKTLFVHDGLAERARQVIGVVGDVRQDALDENPQPEIFVPWLQEAAVASPHGYQNRVHMVLVLRSTLEPAVAMAAVRKIAASLDNTQPVFGARTMSDVLTESTSLRRMYTRLLEVMATLALFLAAIGIYGVISHSVAERSSEIGLRIAVGATQNDILRLIFSQASQLVLAGLCIALALAFALNRLLASYLFEIRPTDPSTIIACCVLLGAVAFSAVWFPARRATQVDPVATLHSE